MMLETEGSISEIDIHHILQEASELSDRVIEYRSLRKRVTSQTVTWQTSFVTSQTHPSRFANVFELFLKRLI